MESKQIRQRVTSPLRYPGGKAKALGMILPLVPCSFSEYREPFLGGGSVFVALKQKYPDAKYKVNDLNQELYCFWNVVKNNVEEMVREVVRIKNRFRNGRSLYERVAWSKDFSDDFGRGLRFYILNRITYSGTVYGGYSFQAFEKRFTIANIEKLKPLSNLLQNVEITNESYEHLLFENGKDVFIYMDPPYWKSMGSRLYGKNGALHKSFNHMQLAQSVKKCQHKWLITFDDSKVIRQLFTFAHIYPWKMQYGMNNVRRKRARKGRELFVANYAIGQGSRCWRKNQPSYGQHRQHRQID